MGLIVLMGFIGIMGLMGWIIYSAYYAHFRDPDVTYYDTTKRAANRLLFFHFTLLTPRSSSLPLILNAIASVGVELAEIRPFIIRCLGGGNG